jgi:hypothetical protein
VETVRGRDRSIDLSIACSSPLFIGTACSTHDASCKRQTRQASGATDKNNVYQRDTTEENVSMAVVRNMRFGGRENQFRKSG